MFQQIIIKILNAVNNNIHRKYMLLCIISVFCHYSETLFSQNARFEITTNRDTLCIDNVVLFKNIQPTNAVRYAWDFCAPDLSKNPQSANINIPNNALDGPAFISTFETPAGVYAFVTNYNDGTISRLLFTDMNIPPTAIIMGSFGGKLPDHPEGIKIVKDGDNYYGFVVGQKKHGFILVRVDFGNDISNINPTVTELTSIGSLLSKPMGISIKKSDNWIAFITNHNSNSITKLTFSNGLQQPPTAELLTGLNLNHPNGIQIINDELGQWYAFVSNYDVNTGSDPFIIRISLDDKLNVLSSDKITDSNISSPFDITFFENCANKYGYILNSLSDAVQIIYSGSLDSNPTGFNKIATNGLSGPHGISEVFRLNNSINVLVSHTSATSNSISRIYYESPCDVKYHLWSNLQTPAAFHYPDTGHYNISLQSENAQGLKSYFCKPVYVAPNPHFAMGNEKFVCPNNKPLLASPPDSIGKIYSEDTLFRNYGTEVYSFTLKRQYINNFQCLYADSIQITEYLPTLNIGNDREELLGTPVTFTTNNNYNEYHWSNGATSQQITVNKEGIYSVQVRNDNDCIQSDTVKLTYRIDVPNFITPNSTMNQTWVVPMLRNYPNADVRIYDRVGNLVAAYKGSYEPGWDGNCNGRPLATDAYWYYIDLHNGGKIMSGSLSIIR
jgi:gliding motility-associated-like protein